MVEAIEEIGIADVTKALAAQSGFASIEDLLATARHGRGERAFLVRFR